jgi:hypothetical protein
MRNLNQDAGAIASLYFGTSCTAVFHAAQRTDAHRYDVMRLATFDVNDKRDATSVVFKSWVVQTACRRH